MPRRAVGGRPRGRCGWGRRGAAGPRREGDKRHPLQQHESRARIDPEAECVPDGRGAMNAAMAATAPGSGRARRRRPRSGARSSARRSAPRRRRARRPPTARGRRDRRGTRSARRCRRPRPSPPASRRAPRARRPSAAITIAVPTITIGMPVPHAPTSTTTAAATGARRAARAVERGSEEQQHGDDDARRSPRGSRRRRRSRAGARRRASARASSRRRWSARRERRRTARARGCSPRRPTRAAIRGATRDGRARVPAIEQHRDADRDDRRDEFGVHGQVALERHLPAERRREARRERARGVPRGTRGRQRLASWRGAQQHRVGDAEDDHHAGHHELNGHRVQPEEQGVAAPPTSAATPMTASAVRSGTESRPRIGRRTTARAARGRVRRPRSRAGRR